MARVNIAATGGSYESKALPMSSQNCVNWIPKKLEAAEGGLNSEMLFEADGILEMANASIPYPTRNAIKMNNIAYFIIGNYFYRLNDDMSLTNLGYISGHGHVSIASSAQYIVINVPNDRAYIFTESDGSLKMVTDPNYKKSGSVVYLDGYFIFNEYMSNLFYCSELNNPFSYDGLDVGSAEISPDPIISLHVSDNTLFVLGESTIELFSNIAGTGFPFKRIQGAFIQSGLYSPASIVNSSPGFAYLGKQNKKAGILIAGASSRTERISTPPIDEFIQEYSESDLQKTIAFSYGSGSSLFLAFTFFSETRASKTFVYDIETSRASGSPKWHERQSGYIEDKWRACYTVDCYGKQLCGDLIDGRIGEINSVGTEYNEIIFREKNSVPLSNKGRSMFISEIEVMMDTGIAEQGDSPELGMKVSDDGSRTWRHLGNRSFGTTGEYDTRLIWRRLGRTPVQRVIKLFSSSITPPRILRVDGEIMGGA
jgi:hypothetical protein